MAPQRRLVASEAAYFIGTMSSSFGRFALMLGAARTGRFAPHFAMDPWHGGLLSGIKKPQYANVGWTQLCRGPDYDEFVRSSAGAAAG